MYEILGKCPIGIVCCFWTGGLEDMKITARKQRIGKVYLRQEVRFRGVCRKVLLVLVFLLVPFLNCGSLYRFGRFLTSGTEGKPFSCRQV